MIIDIFTDGSYSIKNNKIYCGYGIYFPNGEYKNVSKKFKKEPLTNNRAELYAIYKSLKICKKISNENKIEKINIYSDSEYCVKIYTIWFDKWKNNNKNYKNKDIIDKTISIIKNFNNVDFIHIRSHTNKKDYKSIGNEKADELAKKACV